MSVTFVSLVLSLFLSTFSCSSNWQISSFACLDDSNAVGCSQTRSLSDCLVKSEEVKGELLTSWRQVTGRCCTFRYDRVCHLLQAGEGECQMLARFSKLLQFVRTIESKLEGVWTARGGSEFEGLVCRTRDFQFITYNVSWTSEGAAFNGYNSYMLMNSTSFFGVNTGFTHLLRLKRTPQRQGILDSTKFDDPTLRGLHLFEYDAATKLYYAGWVKSDSWMNVMSPSVVLSSSADEWVNVGATVDAETSDARLFVGDSFLPVEQVTRNNQTASNILPVALMLGRGWNDNEFFKGTISALALANSSMTEYEIQQFFARL